MLFTKYLYMSFVVAILTLGYFLPSNSLYAQSDTKKSKLDVHKEADSLKRAALDTVKIFPSKLHGTIEFAAPSLPSLLISKKEVNLMNYYDIEDIITASSFSFGFDVGFPGALSMPSFYGGFTSSNSFSYNGRRLMSAYPTYTDLSTIAPELVESSTLYFGADAAILAGRSANINFAERRYNTAKPFTKLWYTQSGYETIAAEGIFSQNFHPKWNLSIGFRNYSSDGRYDNSALQAWNVRAVLRYNPNDFSSFSFSENFNNIRNGLNGGLDEAKSDEPENELTAIVRYPTLNQRDFSHDITLSYSNSFDTLQNKLLSVNAFVSTYESVYKFYTDNRFLQLDSSGTSSIFSNLAGANFRYSFDLGYFTMTTGADLDYYGMSKSIITQKGDFINYSGFAKTVFDLSNNISLTAGARYEQFLDYTNLSYGSKLNVRFSNTSSTYIDISSSSPIVFLQGDNFKQQSYLLAIAGYKFTNSLNFFSIEAFYRNNDNSQLPIFADDFSHLFYEEDCNCDQLSTVGLEAKYSSFITNSIAYRLGAKSYYSSFDGKSTEFFPALSASAQVTYDYAIGRSTLRAGVSASVASPYTPLEFFPLTKEFARSNYQTDWLNNGINAFVIMKLGPAYLKVGMDNILSQPFRTLNYSPMPDRMFYVSATWTFEG